MSLDRIIPLVATITLFEMMVTIGLSANIADVGRVARDGRLLIRAAVANYVLVPAAAVGLLLLFRAQPMVAAGFLITAVCPGAPYGPPFTGLAKGNVALAVGLMVVLAASSALLAPLLLRLLLPITSGDQSVQISMGALMGTLIGAQLLPLSIGLVVRRVRPAIADALLRPGRLLSAVLNLATFGLILAAQFATLLQIRPIGYLGMLALVGAGLAAGWALGPPGAGNRTAMAMATSVRNVGLAMVIATGSFAGTAAVSAATAFAIFQTLVIAVIALAWGRMASATIPVSLHARA